MVTNIDLGFKKNQDLLVSKRCYAAIALSPNGVKTAVCPVNSNETVKAVKAYVSAPSVAQVKLIEHGNGLFEIYSRLATI